MKKLLLIAAAAIVAFAACQKDPEDTGKQEAKAPVLTKIQPSSGYAGDVATIEVFYKPDIDIAAYLIYDIIYSYQDVALWGMIPYHM